MQTLREGECATGEMHEGECMLGLDHEPVVTPSTAHTLAPPPPLPTGQLRAEAVPQAHKDQPMPLLKVLLPVVMVVAIGAVMALMVMSGRTVSPMMLIFPVMMLFGMVTMFSPQERQGDIDETRRVYLRHLDALAHRARSNAEVQREHAEYLHPAPNALLTAVPAERVWEQYAASPYALQVRIGVGAVALHTPIEVDDPGSPEDLDPVCAVSLRRTVAAVNTIQEMPIVVALNAFPVITMVGPRAAEVARSIVAQLAFFHGPELVGIDATQAPSEFEWVKWLPHSATPEAAEFQVILLDATTHPSVISFSTSAASSENVCVLVIHPDPDWLVDEEAFHLVCDDELHALTGMGLEFLGRPDRISVAEAELIARQLAFYRRPELLSAESASHGGKLLPMLGINDIAELNEHTMWTGREGTRQRLMVPIGSTAQGQALYLDLKESAQGGMGPHGLCIGATGSGKSELLKTLVVALAATHSPEELNLVLVDFKGGATFLGCESLPHTSAVITNLEDESILVERMYDAISGEMNRRQELLRKAGNYANITDYTAARLAGEDLAPLPALVIILDEFSELLAQHPHFADLFVAVGRLGRSLGVHLLLASQRLEEGKLRGLDSHLSYRIGLKTFSAAESRQVLGVPDAYELPSEPGAGFLSTGSGDLERFRAAYVSGPLERARGVTRREAAAEVRLFHGWEPPPVEDAKESAGVDTDVTTTLLAAVVEKSREVADALSMRAHQVWLPPLPAQIELSQVYGGSETLPKLQAIIGVIDEPIKQRQVPLVLDLSVAGGHVALAGGPQTGKSMAVRTMVASLALRHTTDELCFYIIDAGSGDFSDVAELPHVAGVAQRTDEERVRRVVDELVEMLDDPQRRTKRHTVLIVDGWHTLLAPDAKTEDLREPLTRLAAEGPAVGIHLVATTQRWNAIRANVRDVIGTRIELHLTEPMDSVIDRKVQAKLPALPGRGITEEGAFMLVAHTSAQDVAHVRAATQGQPPVPRLRVLPNHVEVADLLTSGGQRLPLGVGGPRLAPLWSESGHLLVIGASGAGKSTAIASAITAIEAMGREQARMVILDVRRAHLGRANPDMVAAYAASTSAVDEAVSALITTLRGRLPGADVTPQQLAQRSWWEGPELYLVIDDLELVPEDTLRELATLFPHARDIGLHVVAARKFGGVSRAMFGSFLSSLKDLLPDVVILDGTRDEGALFGVRPAPQPPGRGLLVQSGEARGLVQVAAPYSEGATL